MKFQFDVQVKIICAVFVTSSPFHGDITLLDAAPKSVKGVKSSSQILDKMHLWRLNACQKSKVLAVLNIVDIISYDPDFEH